MKAATKPTQVIVVKNGQAKTLRGGLLDLRTLGPVTCKRSSDIQFDELTQKHFVEFLDDDLIQYNEVARKTQFDTYEEAVAWEIKTINNHRMGRPFEQ